MKRRDAIGVVARLRRLTERATRGELGRALAERQQQAEALARARAALPPAPTEPISVAQLRSLQLRGLAGREQLAAAAAELETAERWLAEARRDWQQAVLSREATEDLARRRQEQRALHARRAAERALDDLMLLRMTREARS